MMYIFLPIVVACAKSHGDVDTTLAHPLGPFATRVPTGRVVQFEVVLAGGVSP